MAFLIAELVAQQHTGMQVETGTDIGLRKTTACLLLPGLGPYLLVLGRVRHADTGTISHHHAPTQKAVIRALLG